MMNEPPQSLSGRTAIVTGAASGIGAAIATLFSTEGADIAAIDIDGIGLQSIAERVRALGRQCVTIKADLAVEAEINAAAERAVSELGDPHILVNNAGIHISKSLLDTTDEDWNRVIAINVRAPLLLTKAVAARMVERGIKGRVINITSGLAERPVPDMAAYITSKGALRTMTRAIAQELAAHEIAVNSVGPGLTRTDMAARIFQSEDDLDAAATEVPLGRIAEPDDVARTCLFLASDDGNFVAGASVYVDGGALLT